MSFSIQNAEEITALNLTDAKQLANGMEMLTQAGVALFELPDYLHDDGQIHPKVWAERIAGVLLPALGKVEPIVNSRTYTFEGRRLPHRAGSHTGAHYDPRYRDPILFGETIEGSTELRTRIDSGASYRAKVIPRSLWVMAGPALVGGKGTLHELAAPDNGQDRQVTMGATVSK